MVTRAADYPPPSPISESDFLEICGTYKIQKKDRHDVQSRLNDLVTHAAEAVQRQAQSPDRQEDVKAIKRAQKYVQKAGELMLNRGKIAKHALSAISSGTGGFLSERYLRHTFLLPTKGKTKLSAAEKRNLIYEYPDQTMHSMLNHLALSLEAALLRARLMPEARGGRKPNIVRRDVLATLTDIWYGLGKRIEIGPRSEFVQFCDTVLASMGWPTEGLDSALRKAVKRWRNLSQNTT